MADKKLLGGIEMKNIFAEGLENIRRFEEAKEKFGAVKMVIGKQRITTVAANNGGDRLHEYWHKNLYREIALTQQPYIDGPVGDAVFRASGIDAEGTDYEIYWAIKEGMENAEDMQEMCDWDNPAEIVEM